MFALIDCNNFFVSCERLFRPDLARKPVVVLSNNDGCVVSRSSEVKALGVKMGAPWFKVRDLARQHGIVPFSSNYVLYADISNRVMQLLGCFAPQQEVYSIDECFLDLTGWSAEDRHACGLDIRRTLQQQLGMPVCVGIGATKTLAKLANHIAKQSPRLSGVFDLANQQPTTQRQYLQQVEVGEVWGVGRRLAPRLQAMGIHSAYDLQTADPATIRRQFSVVMERTVAELNGEACLPLESVASAKKQIISSRSFGRPVFAFDELSQSVVSHTRLAAEKLRAQRSLAGGLLVYIRTNPHQPREPQYSRSFNLPLMPPSQDTRTLIAAAIAALQQVYREGYAYAKAGVMLLEISPASEWRPGLFDDPTQRRRSDALMQTLDQINRHYGKGTLKFLGEGLQQDWRMRSEHRSPNYTTRIEDLLEVGEPR